MAVRRPTPVQVYLLAETLGLTLDDAEVAAYGRLLDGTLAAYDLVAGMVDAPPPVRYPRTPGSRPEGAENPHNAWYVKTEIRGARRGRLAGRRVAVKDNVCLAGVPMMVGAATLEGFVPDVDATVVTRMLDAGATIAGKAHCEAFCLSGSSHTGAYGPVHNPHRRGYSAGGSSSGSAVLVATGEVAMAIGGDQGGSIRIPASLSGVVGMKPTYGLVPYTGVMPIELTLDHVGPMTANVAENALLLEVIAGADGLDPRQYAPRKRRYAAGIEDGIEGLSIGVVGEAFAMENAEDDVSEAVRATAARLAELGARTAEVSLRLHPLAKPIWTPIAIEGLAALMMKGNGYGTNHRGLYVTGLMDAHAAWRERADDLPPTLKLCLIAAEHMAGAYRGRLYAKAQNLRRRVRAEYDAALAEHDLLLMPTTPSKATPMPPADAAVETVVAHAFAFNANCIPTNLTGHPALSFPCAMRDGLPVGAMLVGRDHDEATLYRAARAFERAFDWRAL